MLLSNFKTFISKPYLVSKTFQGLYNNWNNRRLSKTCGHHAITFQCHYQTLWHFEISAIETTEIKQADCQPSLLKQS